jgi:HTH-type transcriptional regulator, sugar sensing transcriptional regulator
MALNPNENKEIQEVLTMFGFGPKDQEVYLGLLSFGQSTLTPLARDMGLPVSTVQSAMQRLVKKGVVDVSKRKSRQVFEAADPSVFKDLLKEQAKGIGAILPLLTKLKTDPLITPKLKVFRNERVSEIFNESLECKSGVVLEIVSAKAFQQVIGEKYHYSRRRVKAGVHLKSLRVREHEIKKYSSKTHARELREARFLPPELTFEANVLLWDDTAAFFSTKPEGLHWMVQNKSITEMMKQIFHLLWSVSGKMETLTEEKSLEILDKAR